MVKLGNGYSFYFGNASPNSWIVDKTIILKISNINTCIYGVG